MVAGVTAGVNFGSYVSGKVGWSLLINMSVVQLIEHPRVHSRKLLHGQVNVLEPIPQANQQQLSNAASNGCGVACPGQLAQVQPLTALTLLPAEVDVVGERAQPADDIHVGHAKSSGVVVLLPDTEQRPEL